jgi:hypothetical protein
MHFHAQSVYRVKYVRIKFTTHYPVHARVQAAIQQAALSVFLPNFQLQHTFFIGNEHSFTCGDIADSCMAHAANNL